MCLGASETAVDWGKWVLTCILSLCIFVQLPAAVRRHYAACDVKNTAIMKLIQANTQKLCNLNICFFPLLQYFAVQVKCVVETEILVFQSLN
jgi:hypothetical protein